MSEVDEKIKAAREEAGGHAMTTSGGREDLSRYFPGSSGWWAAGRQPPPIGDDAAELARKNWLAQEPVYPTPEIAVRARESGLDQRVRVAWMRSVPTGPPPAPPRNVPVPLRELGKGPIIAAPEPEPEPTPEWAKPLPETAALQPKGKY